MDDAALDTLQGLFDGAQRPGRRLSVALLDYATSDAFALLRAALSSYRPARLVAFDKADDANWGLPWHQDRVIAVKERHDIDGFKNWGQKDGVWHCQPPEALLRDMVFARIHLDGAGPEDGPMEMALASHARGLVPADAAAKVAANCAREDEFAASGDVLLLSMLTLHRSKPSTSGARRRVLRVDFARRDLPSPLEWAA